MMIVFLLALVSLTLSGESWAQEFDDSNIRPHQVSAVPPTARFEFVQSHIAARSSYRLDKFTGNVQQIVQTESGDLTWENVRKLAHPEDYSKEGEVNYQIFLSGMANRFSFLMNVRTGAMWQLAEDPKTNELFWTPML